MAEVSQDLRADLKQRAKSIANALKAAFGGASQVGTTDIGRAIAGHINNNGLDVHGTLEEVCIAVMDAFWGDADDEIPIWAVVGACQASLDAIGVRYDGLPYPVANPSERFGH